MKTLLLFIALSALSLNGSSTTRFKNNTTKSIYGDSQKFCYDDTYGTSGMKLQITLFDNKEAKIEYLKDGAVVRSGKATWRQSVPLGDNAEVTLNLSTGYSLKFTAVLSLMKRITMLIDSRDNIYQQCF
jgi:hypothetical protein